MNRDLSYLFDIVRFGKEILQFVTDMDEDAFLLDIKTQNAVLYSITLMGEAVKRLTPEFRSHNSQIPWKQIAGMRDKCIHDYRQIDMGQVWMVTQEDIPDLLDRIEFLLHQ